MQRPTGWLFSSVLGLLLSIGLVVSSAIAEDIPIVDGTLWSQSSTVEKKSYLVGASNLLSLEYAFQNRSKNPPTDEQTTIQDFFTRIDDVSIDETIRRVNEWYDKNPDKLDVAVLAVIWVDMVEPNLK